MRKSTRINTKKQSRKRRYKSKCRRSNRRCVARRRTRKQYGASGKRSIGEAVDEMRQRLKQQDSSWYNANVVPAEERSAKRRAEIDAMNRPEAFTAPSIARMGDPEMMRMHLETLDRAEERDNQLLKLALERSIARADAEQQREEEKYSLKNLYPITGGPKPLFHYAGHIMSDEKVPAGSKFKNLFTNDDTQPQKKRRR
jgi:hypothetical protein